MEIFVIHLHMINLANIIDKVYCFFLFWLIDKEKSGPRTPVEISSLCEVDS